MLALSLLLSSSLPVQATEVQRQIEQPVRQSIQTHQSTQKNEEQWRTDKERLTARFEQLQEENKELGARKEALGQTITATSSRLAGKRQQLADIARITSEIEPFLDQLLLELGRVVDDGPPFLRNERSQRLERLQTMRTDPTVSVGEQYRKLMEALLVEAEYGFSTEVYQDHIAIDGQTILADIFRLGRLNLFYLTLDQHQCGLYNEASHAWQPLTAAHLHAIQTAFAIGAKRQPVELLNLPVGRMVRP